VLVGLSITHMTTTQIPNYIRTDSFSYVTDEGVTRTVYRDIIALEITFGRETRTVEFKVFKFDDASTWRADNNQDFFARIGCGEKSHACTASAWLKDGKWEFTKSTRALNRQAYVVGFRDNARDTFKSQHSGSKIAKGVKQ
jgi:hypothetical protein